MAIKMDLRGKTAFITGGARGVGKGLAKGVLDTGGQVCALDATVYIYCK